VSVDLNMGMGGIGNDIVDLSKVPRPGQRVNEADTNLTRLRVEDGPASRGRNVALGWPGASLVFPTADEHCHEDGRCGEHRHDVRATGVEVRSAC
jgi:hypothetical protein